MGFRGLGRCVWNGGGMKEKMFNDDDEWTVKRIVEVRGEQERSSTGNKVRSSPRREPNGECRGMKKV
jgi:hypothetical protein